MTEPTDRPNRTRRRAYLRGPAAVLAVALAFAAVAPPLAAAEVESEGEGSGPPGSTPTGLEEGYEPGGEETALEELPEEPGEEEVEEVVPEEVEAPAPPTEPPSTASVPAAPEPAPEMPPPAQELPPPPVTGPTYAPEERSPSYEPAPAGTATEVVRNEAIVAPAQSTEHRRTGRRAAATEESEPRTPAPVEPEAPPPATEQVVVPSTPAATPGSAGRLAGRTTHTVTPGECLWSIAEGVLPAGAADAAIAAEVARLWRLNAARIGTGDPSLILVGTVLRLR